MVNTYSFLIILLFPFMKDFWFERLTVPILKMSAISASPLNVISNERWCPAICAGGRFLPPIYALYLSDNIINGGVKPCFYKQKNAQRYNYPCAIHSEHRLLLNCRSDALLLSEPFCSKHLSERNITRQIEITSRIPSAGRKPASLAVSVRQRRTRPILLPVPNRTNHKD